MEKELAREKAHVDGVFYCTHKPEEQCACRKPNTGLLDQAIKGLGVKPEECAFIGDSFIDMNAGKKFGAKTVLVFSGKEKVSNRANWEFEPDYISDNLLVAAHYLCEYHV